MHLDFQYNIKSLLNKYIILFNILYFIKQVFQNSIDRHFELHNLNIIYCLFYINKLYNIYLPNLIKSLSVKIVHKTLEGYGIRVPNVQTSL